MFACGSENLGEYYGDLEASPQGLVLTQEEHEGGWGRSRCFLCHAIENIHINYYSTTPGVDLNAVRSITITGGDSSCVTCHGSNGVQ